MKYISYRIFIVTVYQTNDSLLYFLKNDKWVLNFVNYFFCNYFLIWKYDESYGLIF